MDVRAHTFKKKFVRCADWVSIFFRFVHWSGPASHRRNVKSSSFLADQQAKQLRQVLYLALGERIELLLHRFAIGGPHFLLKRAALGRQCDELAAGELVVLMPRVVR